MSLVAKMLWVLESRFREPVSLDDLVEVTGKSPTYLSRLFPMVTGYSITGYLRARRLTEAARALAAGAPDILAVALDAGYGSHEAFTRAFRNQFGITPELLRRRRSLDDIALVEPYPMTTDINVNLTPPVFENRQSMRFAGISQRHQMSHGAGIPAQWQQFQPYLGNVDGALGKAAFGIVGDAETNGEDFEYITAVEVRPDADLPPELTVIAVPALRWARFTHSGDVTSLRATIGAASDWLAEAGYEASGAPYSFLEYYGPAFDAQSGAGDVEVWFGLKD
ncbi:MAG: AraC family transcriptional regulator [Devosia sp.]|nr:AraC family transcriptional regulator [Devosia sp.]